jgi:quercetin dioxygenase-like cupin family protein
MNGLILVAAAAIATSSPAIGQSTADPDQQTVARAGSLPALPAPMSNFTGRPTVRALANPVAPGRAAFGEVTFPAGARSHWHTHPAGQVLYVLKGCGLTQQEGGPVTRICQGDTVYTPPGVKHWHGATPDGEMVQLSVTETVDGRNVDWLEPVSDAQYPGRAQRR